MTDNAWKVFERWMCRLFGGERAWEVPAECKGTGMFAPEAKYRKKLPDWLVGTPDSMMEQAERQAKDNQLPLVVLTQHYMPRMQSIVIIRLQDFYDWYVGGHNEPPEYDGPEIGYGPPVGREFPNDEESPEVPPAEEQIKLF